jgi:hypothetical protein
MSIASMPRVCCDGDHRSLPPDSLARVPTHRRDDTWDHRPRHTTVPLEASPLFISTLACRVQLPGSRASRQTVHARADLAWEWYARHGPCAAHQSHHRH